MATAQATPRSGFTSTGLTRDDLGAGYLVVTAVALSLGLLAFLFLTVRGTAVFLAAATVAVAPYVAISYVGLVAYRGRLPDDFVWSVATWFALGLSVATAVAMAIGLGWTPLDRLALAQVLVVTLIATGSLVGALVGSVVSLRRYQTELRTLHQRNSVMNRVLRHNIRNDVNVIQAHAALLGAETDDGREHTDVIERKARDILSLSAAARDVDAMAKGGDHASVDLAALVEDYVDHAADRFPAAAVTAAVPPTCPVATDPVVRSVIDNLVENAVQHNDGDAEVVVELDRVDDGTVELRVRDDGPGIPRDQFEVLFADGEAHNAHGSGLGLWLVKWFVDRHDGTLRLEQNEPRGSVVCLELPVADAE